MTHERFRVLGRKAVIPLSIIVPVILSPLTFRQHGEVFIGVGIFLGYEWGKYCTPDWDCATMTSSESWLIRDLPIFGHLVFGLSSAYGSATMRYHRSIGTHFPVISTFPRYLLVFWYPWLEIYRSELDWAWLVCLFIGMFMGTSIADGIHAYLDWIRYPKSE